MPPIRGEEEKMLEAILFDFDDTLIHYKTSEEYGLTKALEECGVEVKSEYLLLYSEVNRKLWRLAEKGVLSTAELRLRRFETLIRETGIEVGISAKKLDERYLHHFAEVGKVEDGAFGMLRWLGGLSGLRKAIITNGFSDTQRRRIERTRIGDYFDQLYISGEMGAKKPEPEMFQMVLENLEISDPERVLIVGDNLVSDMMGGKKSGLLTCWYNPQRRDADIYAEYIDFEIPHLSCIRRLPFFAENMD